jgi:acetoin utilization deacetylase AcuC-like enzyme
MKAFYSDLFVLPLPEDHRFPMQKYALLRERALATQLLTPDDLIIPDPATDEEIRRVHSADYLRKVVTRQLTEKEMRRIGFPWSPQMVERTRRSVGGTISACRTAFQDGVAANLAGGTHHAFPDFGAGFCVFNDVSVAARAMLAEERARRVVILDCDVHQGDGTAAIFAQDDRVFTFSIHGARNFPFRKQQSDLDIELEDNPVMKIPPRCRSVCRLRLILLTPTSLSIWPEPILSRVIDWGDWVSAKRDWPRGIGM